LWRLIVFLLWFAPLLLFLALSRLRPLAPLARRPIPVLLLLGTLLRWFFFSLGRNLFRFGNVLL
jgi:hypothetical protein